jgi:hypothetical protein
MDACSDEGCAAVLSGFWRAAGRFNDGLLAGATSAGAAAGGGAAVGGGASGARFGMTNLSFREPDADFATVALVGFAVVAAVVLGVVCEAEAGPFA